MKKILLLTISFCLNHTLTAQDGPFSFNGKTRIFTGNAIHWNADQDASTNLIWRSWSNRYFDFNGTVFRQDGKVGIGTTSPRSNFNVNGTNGEYWVNQSGHQIFYNKSSATTSSFWTVAPRSNGRFSIGYGPLSSGTYGEFVHFDNDLFTINSSNGNVGIGTTSPNDKLEVIGSFVTRVADGGNRLARIANSSNAGEILVYANNTLTTKVDANGKSYFNGGNVGIGTTTPGEKLEVNGNALIDGELYSKKVKVSVNPGNWPDFVFASSYELRALSEVEDFVKENGHLPEVPSAKEVEKEGIDLGDMDATLLKKVEELTLYMIDQDKRLNKLEKENTALKQEIKKLQTDK